MFLDEICDVLREMFPFTFVVILPILIILAPGDPVRAAHDFKVFRMQQYDLQTSTYGSRNSILNAEARFIDAKVLLRKCALTTLKDFSFEKLHNAVMQNAAGLVIILPANISNLAPDDEEMLLDVENKLLFEETSIPVYVAIATPDIMDIYEEVVHFGKLEEAASVVEGLLGSITANGFQFVVDIPNPSAQMDFEIVNIQGELTGLGSRERLPTITIIAHYDAFGIAPTLSFGADSNGSGVAMLLELVRIFSKLYSSTKTQPKYNLVFLLSGAGKFNYQGTRRWVDDQLDAAASESSLLSELIFALCLDSVGMDDSLYLHVSKPPKEGSQGEQFVKNLELAAAKYDVKFNMVHKKINLADDFLAWEHEKFSIRKQPGFTLSRHSHHKSPRRKTMLDTRQKIDMNKVIRNTKLVADALAMHLYNLSLNTQDEFYPTDLQVDETYITMWMDFLTSHSRSAQLLHKHGVVIKSLSSAFNRHLKDSALTLFKTDKRDPEFVFYDAAEGFVKTYNVKPAVFDLFLACVIAAYMGVLYFVIQKFGIVLMLLNTFNGTKLGLQMNGFTKAKVQ